MKISDIIIGHRARKDMGDLRSLADSIARHGLLHPVVVKKDNTLVAGHRRIEAARFLGWTEIPATVVDVADLLSAERDENTERKDFTPTEAVAIGRLIEEQHRAKIKATESAVKRDNISMRYGAIKERSVEPPGPARENAARAVGMSPSSYDRAKQIVSAAESEPEKFGDLPAQMDETRNVSGTHRELKRRKSGEGRHPVFKKMHHRKWNREVERAVHALDGICYVLKQIPTKELDQSRTKTWAKDLRKSTSAINSFVRRINGQV